MNFWKEWNKNGGNNCLKFSTLTSPYSFFSHAKSRSKMEKRLFGPPGSLRESMSSRYLTANGGFEVQLELRLLNKLLEWYTVSAAPKNLKKEK